MKKYFLILLMTIISGCSTIKQNNQVAIYMDADKGEFIPIKNIRNYVSNDYFKISHELAILSENIYRENESEYKDINESCSILKVDYKTKLPTPSGWEIYLKPEPIKVDKWWVWGESDGMQIEVWKKTKINRETIFSIVFRGTDFKEINDWYSNLRWITRINPTYLDQYDQTRLVVPILVKKIRSEYKNEKIISTGHSLGGGLAQQAAYVSDQINEVYAYSPSAVTGYFSVNKKLREKSSKGLVIYRIYEKGEVLGYLRSFMRNLSPLTKENPKIVEIGYNFNEGSIIEDHSIRKLACGLYANFEIDTKEGFVYLNKSSNSLSN